MSDMEAILESGAALGLEYAASRLAAQGKPPANCANCGAPLVGPYCAMCGQEPDMHRRTVASLAHDLVSDVANFDSRILRTAKALLFQPGELPRAFHEGRTRRYVPALRLYFFVTLIFFVILSASGIAILQFQVAAAPVKIFHDAKGGTYFINPAYDPNNAEGKAAPRLIPVPQEKAGKSNELYWFMPLPRFFRPTIHSSGLTPAMRRQLAADERLAEAAIADRGSAAGKKGTGGLISWLKEHVYTGIERLAANPAALNEPLTNWIPRVLFLMLPLYALLLAVFYWRQRKTFYLVDHLTFSLSVHSFTFVALIVAVGLAQVLSGGLIFWLFLLAVGAYVLLSIRRFYRQSWFWSSVKTLAVSGIYTLFFLLPAMFGIVVYTFLYS